MAKKNQILSSSKLCIFLLLLLFSYTAYGQNGVINGIVYDAKLNEPLIGASVFIEGTTIGGITDIDGNFRIENVKPGAYTVKASYVSYETATIPDVAVTADKETTLDIRLSDASLQLQNVVVVAQRKLGTEMAVLNTVRESLPVANGISAQQINKTQDSDAAEVLRRIPGITIIEDRFVVVRGLAQRYNNVWLNNAITPSGETDKRAFSFDVLPSSLIDNLMIYKSPSAEFPADFSGGFVRILTKNIPDGNSFTISYQAGYDTNATFRQFELTKGNVGDYFGFGAGSRMLPSNAPAHLNDLSVPDAAAFTRKVNKGWDINKFTAVPEQKLSLTLNRSFKAGNWQIGNVTSVNYSNDYNYYETKNNNYLSYDMKNDVSSYRYRFEDVQYKNTVKLGGLFNFSFLNGKNKLELRNFFNQRGIRSLSQREGTDYYSDENIRKWESLYTSRTTYSGQLSGNHRFREEINSLDWTLGYAYAGYNEPDRKDVKSIERVQDDKKQYYVSDPTRYYQKLTDHGFSLATNYEHKLIWSPDIAPVIQTGLYGEYKKRDFSARRFVYNLLGNGYNRYADWDYSSIFSDENITADRIYMKESTNKSDSYTSNHLLGAAYLSAKLKYRDKFNASIGLRLEHYRLKLDGYEADGIKEVSLDPSFTDLFPSVNLSYNLNNRNQIRAAYGRSVNRPEFREVVPYVYYDFGLNANISGNAGLENAYADNLDIRYEFYPSPGEAITLGAFYKRFDNPIEQTFSETGSGLQYTFHNADRARTFGVELDVKKQLDFIGLPNLNVVFNGAWIESKVFFPEGSFERDRPMQGQSPYLVNAGLFYQDEDREMSASLLFNRIGKRIETVGIPKQNPNDDIPDIYEMPRNSLDLTFSKKIGKIVELKAGIQDILNARTEYKQLLELTEESGSKREVEQLIRSFRPGMRINVGISIKI